MLGSFHVSPVCKSMIAQGAPPPIRSVRRAVMTSLIAVLLESAAKSFGRLAACLPTRLTYREIISMKPPSRGRAQGNNGIRASAMSHPIPMKSSWLTVARAARGV
jgi:hypothetical protein